jgi:carboxyl-terminal processing protease
LRELVDGHFAACDALLLDLRGRGGFPTEVDRVLRVLDAERNGWSKPVVALIDAGTRSAKEVLAWRLRSSERALLVGEATAGAVLPASFAPVGDGAVLMYPAATLGAMSARLESRGVLPDVPVELPLTPAQGGRGDDPIFSAAIVAARVWCEARASIR